MSPLEELSLRGKHASSFSLGNKTCFGGIPSYHRHYFLFLFFFYSNLKRTPGRNRHRRHGSNLQPHSDESETPPPCLTTWSSRRSPLETSWTCTARPALAARRRSTTRTCQPSFPSWWRRTGWSSSSSTTTTTGARSVGGSWCSAEHLPANTSVCSFFTLIYWRSTLQRRS